jgi:hypothetical protein
MGSNPIRPTYDQYIVAMVLKSSHSLAFCNFLIVMMSWLSTISTSSPTSRSRLSRIGLGILIPTEFPHLTSLAVNFAMSSVAHSIIFRYMLADIRRAIRLYTYMRHVYTCVRPLLMYGKRGEKQ